jgi:hypothetical protein
MHYRKIWETYNNKKIPKNHDIHHIDGDRTNNDPSNLMCVSLEEHLEIHYKQKDWGAVQAILMRMECDSNQISEAASKFQLSKLKNKEHNFQKMTLERRSEISRKTIQKRMRENGVAFLGIKDVVENSRNAGKKAAEKKAGFLNINSENHGSKHVKGTCWWTNIETGERIRAKEAPNEKWKRGMLK